MNDTFIYSCREPILGIREATEHRELQAQVPDPNPDPITKSDATPNPKPDVTPTPISNTAESLSSQYSFKMILRFPGSIRVR